MNYTYIYLIIPAKGFPNRVLIPSSLIGWGLDEVTLLQPLHTCLDIQRDLLSRSQPLWWRVVSCRADRWVCFLGNSDFKNATLEHGEKVQAQHVHIIFHKDSSDIQAVIFQFFYLCILRKYK